MGYENVAIFDQYLAISEMVEDRWVYAARRFTSIESSFQRRDSPEVAKLWLRLVFKQLTRDLFAIAKFLLSLVSFCTVSVVSCSGVVELPTL